MKIVIFLLFFSLLLSSKHSEQTNAIYNQQEEVFKPGEDLRYEMSYGWITGGEASLSLEQTKFQGKDVYHVKAIGKTIGVAHAIYNVKDSYESYFDPETGKPYRSLMSLKEGDYRNYSDVYFYHNQGILISSKKGEQKIDRDVFDIVSAFYHVRKSLDNLKVGDKIVVHTYFHDDPWDLVIRYKGVEVIKTGLGKISCLKFKPIVLKGTFENEDALDIWLSNDQNKIPIRVKMSFFVGSFKTDLVKYSGLTNKINFY